MYSLTSTLGLASPSSLPFSCQAASFPPLVRLVLILPSPPGSWGPSLSWGWVVIILQKHIILSGAPRRYLSVYCLSSRNLDVENNNTISLDSSSSSGSHNRTSSTGSCLRRHGPYIQLSLGLEHFTVQPTVYLSLDESDLTILWPLAIIFLPRPPPG